MNSKNNFVQAIKDKPVNAVLSTFLVANAAMLIAGAILTKQGKISPEIFMGMVVSAVAFLSLALAFSVMMQKGEKGADGVRLQKEPQGGSLEEATNEAAFDGKPTLEA